MNLKSKLLQTRIYCVLIMLLIYAIDRVLIRPQVISYFDGIRRKKMKSDFDAGPKKVVLAKKNSKKSRFA